MRKQKRFYNRETIAALNYEIQKMSFIPPIPLYATQLINPFLVQGSQPMIILSGGTFSSYHYKDDSFSQCFELKIHEMKLKYMRLQPGHIQKYINR